MAAWGLASSAGAEPAKGARRTGAPRPPAGPPRPRRAEEQVARHPQGRPRPHQAQARGLGVRTGPRQDTAHPGLPTALPGEGRDPGTGRRDDQSTSWIRSGFSCFSCFSWLILTALQPPQGAKRNHEKHEKHENQALAPIHGSDLSWVPAFAGMSGIIGPGGRGPFLSLQGEGRRLAA